MPNKKKPRSVKLLLLAIVIGVAVLVIGTLVNGQLSLQADRAKFTEAKQMQSTIASRLQTELGEGAKSNRTQNECFHAEQGPYTEGNLWCQSTQIIRLSSEVNYRQVGENFLSIGRDLSLKTSQAGNPFPSYTIVLNNGVRCDLEWQDASGNHEGGAISTPFSEQDRSAIAVACADRAMEAYYPIVE